MLPPRCDFHHSAALSLNQVSPSPTLLDPILLTLPATEISTDSFLKKLFTSYPVKASFESFNEDNENISFYSELSNSKLVISESGPNMTFNLLLLR